MALRVLMMTSVMTLWLSCDAKFTMTLMHTNDVRARYEQFTKYGSTCTQEKANQGKCYGGFARLKTAVDRIRGKYKNTLLLDGGDQYQGTLYFYRHGGTITSDFMNYLHYNATAVGNHEFDRGVEGLVPFLTKAQFPVLSANMDTGKEPALQWLVSKYTVRLLQGRLVAIVGYTTQEAPYVSHTGNVTFNDVVTSVKQEVKMLRSEGVKVIIALGHAGFRVDQQVAQIPGVSVVIGGHTKTFLYTVSSGKPPSNEVPAGPYPTVVTRADGTRSVVAQCFTWAKYLCVLHLTFSDTDGQLLSYSGNPQLLDSSVPQDRKALQHLKLWKQQVENLRTEVIGHTSVTLEGSRKVCRTKECNLGNLIADAMIAQNKDHPDESQWADVNIALINSGAIRSTIPQGNIIVGDVLSVLPFGNTVYVLEINGKYLKETFEHSVYGMDPCQSEDLFGGFLQTAGIQVEYNLAQPAGQRVASLKAQVAGEGESAVYEHVEDYIDYQILVTSYLVSGGDGYDVLANHAENVHPIGDVDSDIMVEFIKEISTINTGLNGRITFTSDSDVCNTTTLDADATRGTIKVI